MIRRIAKADPGKYAPNDSLSKQQGNDKGTQNYSIDHIIAGTDPNVLVDKTQSTKDGPCNVHTKTGTEKEARYDQEFNTSPKLISSDDATKEIKLEDLLKLVKDVGIDLMDLDSPEDDEPFIVQSDEDEEEVHVEPHARTEDTSIPKPPSLKSIKIKELTNQVLILQYQNIKLEKAQANAEAEATLFKAQPSFLNLKELPSKFNKVSGAVRDLKQYVEGQEIKVPGDLKEIHEKLDEFYSTISSSVVEAQGLGCSSKTKKDAAKSNLNKETVIPTKAPETAVIPPTITITIAVIILTTLPLQSPFLYSSPKTTPQTKGGFIPIELELDGPPSTLRYRLEWTTCTKQKKELEIDFSKALGEHDPIIKLNTLAKKKRKHVHDFHEYFSSLLLAEVDKRNLNPLKQMRVIKQLGHLSVDLNIKYPKYSLAEDNSVSVLQVLRRSSSIFTSVYVAVQKLKNTLARASVQLGWQCQAERC
ncbi:hypothetical protein Tco_1410166 [Tanacetum coccineum]